MVEVVRNVWWYTKRPTNVYLVVDTSGSMEGDKIELTRAALQSFAEQIRGDRDQAGLITFATSVHVRHPLQPLTDAGRAELRTAINQIQAKGNTALIDGVWQAYTALQLQGDLEAIAFGSDADEALMRSIAEIGGGQFRRADETDIEELYKIISTYF